MHPLDTLCVTPLAHLPKTLKSFQPDAVISILDPGDSAPPLPGFKGQRLLLGMVDNAIPNPKAPGVLAALFAFLAPLPPSAKLLFHCVAGKSRSPALAVIVAASRVGPQQAQTWIASHAPGCRPNPWLLLAGDDHLSLNPTLASLFPDSFPRPSTGR